MRGEPDPCEFESVVEPFTWGGATYVILRVPPALYSDAMALGTRRVAGSMNGHRVNVGVTTAPGLPDPYVYLGPGLRTRIEAGQGDVVDCVLAPVDPDLVDLPADVESALTLAEALDRWEAIRPAIRRQRLAAIESAKRQSTRERRIAALVAEVCAG